MRSIDKLTMAYNESLSTMKQRSAGLNEAQQESISALEKRGYNVRSVLTEGNAFMVKTGGGSHKSVEIDSEGRVNGESLASFLLK